VAKPKEVLSPADYKNYRNVRVVLLLFVIQGSFLLLLILAGIIGLASEKGPDKFQTAVGLGIFAAFALAGAVGQIATLRGSRRWAPLVYVVAAVHIIFFPIGTILGYVILTGLSRYLGSVECIRGAAR
jgi:hypothetical protein